MYDSTGDSVWFSIIGLGAGLESMMSVTANILAVADLGQPDQQSASIANRLTTSPLWEHERPLRSPPTDVIMVEVGR